MSKNWRTPRNLNYLQDLRVRIILNTFVFRILSLLSREVVFLAVSMKIMANPLGIITNSIGKSYF